MQKVYMLVTLCCALLIATAQENDTTYLYLNQTGERKFEQKDIEEAISWYGKSIAANPRYFKAYYNRAIAKTVSGKYEDALKDYSTAIELKPDFAPAYKNRGIVYYLTGNKTAAADDFKKATQLGLPAPNENLLILDSSNYVKPFKPE